MRGCSRGPWLLLAGVLTSTLSSAQPSAVEFEVLSLREGLSQGTVFSILQDRYGFMWLGTADGLNRFDGYEFRHYRTDPADSASISDNRVIALLEDRAGRLWAGTLGGGLCRFERETETFVRYRHDPRDSSSLSDDRVNSLYEDSRGNLWVGTTHGGLNRFDPSSGRFVAYRHDPDDPWSISDNHIYPIHEDGSGRLWVGTPKGLNLLHRESGRFERILHDSSQPESLSNDYVNAIASDRSGALWVGTVDGLNRLVGEVRGGTHLGRAVRRWKFSRFYSDSSKAGTLASSTIWALFVDRSGTLWIGTDVGGLNRYDSATRTFELLGREPFDRTVRSHNAVRSLAQDRSGTLWVGTNAAGVRTWNPLRKKFRTVSADGVDGRPISSDWIRALSEDGRGRVWVGTAEPVLDIYDPRTGGAEHMPMPGSVEAILEGEQGAMWLGTSQGLLKRHPGAKSFRSMEHIFRGLDTLAGRRIRSLAFDRAGNLWVGFFRRGLARIDRTTSAVTAYSHDPRDSSGVSDNYVRAVRRDHRGDLWIGSYGGLDLFDERTGTFRHFRYDSQDRASLSNNNVLCLYDFPEDSGSVLWVGTFGGGLNRLEKATGRVRRYTTRDGLPNDVVYGILGDDSGNLWISTNRGIARLTVASGEIVSFDESDGLQGYEFSTGAYHRGSSGTMYFGGVNGFSFFHPDSIRDSRYEPPIVVTRIQTLDGVIHTDMGQNARVVLSYGTKYLSFEFASLDYTNPSKNLYAYRMEGFDDAWTRAGTRRYASFTKLDPGTYTFAVKGTNSDGLWSDREMRIEVIVTPPFWQAWWFVSAAAVFLVGLAAVVIRRRERLKEEKARIMGELQSARRVQMGLMPTSDPEVPGLEVSGVCMPAHEVGGDFFDYLWLDPDHSKFGIVLADVSGKGMNAAMTAVMASGMLYREIEDDPAPSTVLRNINRSLFLKTDRRMFVSMLVGFFDTKERVLAFSNAGQALPLRRRNGTVSRLTGQGERFALGMVQAANYDDCTIQLQPGDVLVFYTDGVSEASDEGGELLDTDRLERVVGELPHELSARAMVERIIGAVRTHTGSPDVQDDTTIVVAKVR